MNKGKLVFAQVMERLVALHLRHCQEKCRT